MPHERRHTRRFIENATLFCVGLKFGVQGVLDSLLYIRVHTLGFLVSQARLTVIRYLVLRFPRFSGTINAYSLPGSVISRFSGTISGYSLPISAISRFSGTINIYSLPGSVISRFSGTINIYSLPGSAIS